MATKTEFVAFRAEPEQARRLKQIASMIGRSGNLSAAMRWLVDSHAPGEPAQQGAAPASANKQAEREVHHAT